MTRWILVPALLLPLLAGCNREHHCKCELIDDSGKFEATTSGRRPEEELKREAMRAACDKRCAGTPSAVEACVSRCTVDAVVGKIGMRTTCADHEIKSGDR